MRASDLVVMSVWKGEGGMLRMIDIRGVSSINP